MKRVKADIHIHTLLSPCGDLDMTPREIVERAAARKLDIIGITDHNSTRQVTAVEELASERNIYVMGGVEITTAEEVHCLAFFPDRETRELFQEFIDEHLPDIPNKDGAFGYQVLVDAEDQILAMEERLLVTALLKGIEEIEHEVHRLGGIFIPAHVDRPVNSIFSQLGFIPDGLRFEALGITRNYDEHSVRQKFNIENTIALIQSSDAHYPGDIGRGYALFTLETISFEEIRMALAGTNGRSVRNPDTAL